MDGAPRYPVRLPRTNDPSLTQNFQSRRTNAELIDDDRDIFDLIEERVGVDLDRYEDDVARQGWEPAKGRAGMARARARVA